MSGKRLESLRRILAVQSQLKRRAEWKLADLESKGQEIDKSQQEVIAALNADHNLHGLFVETMSRNLAALAKRSDAVRAAAEVERQELRERSGMVRQAERRARIVDQENRRVRERTRLEDIIDELARPDRASPK